MIDIMIFNGWSKIGRWLIKDFLVDIVDFFFFFLYHPDEG